MKTNISNRPWWASQPASSSLWASGAALTAALLLLAPASLRAGTANGVVVGPLGGGGYAPYYGYVDGDTAADSEFHTPIGLAMDSTGDNLYVADRDNNAIRLLDLAADWTYTFVPIDGITPSGTISSPVGVALDVEDNLYVLNRGNGNNGTLLRFDYEDYGYWFTNIATNLANANGLALDSGANIYLTVSNNTVIRISPSGARTTIATITNAGTLLQGICVMSDGNLAVCDSGRNGILRINPATPFLVTTNTGFNGPGDNTFGNNSGVPKAAAKFNQPYGIAAAANGVLIVSDYGNNRVKVVNSAGTVTNLYGVSSSLWYTGSGAWPGWFDGNVTVPDAVGDVEARAPNGVVLAGNGTVYVTEDYYHLIRTAVSTRTPFQKPIFPPRPPSTLTGVASCGQVSLTWSASVGATSYNLKRSSTSGGPYATLASTSSTNYTDTGVLSGTTYYYVVSAVNATGEGLNSAEVSATPPLPPAPGILTVLTNYGQVALTWSAAPCASVTYNVKRSTSGSGPYTTIASTATTSYTDTSVLNGTTYYYVISAFNAGGEGPNSAPVSATLPLPPVPTPQFGYVDFPATSTPVPYTSVFYPESSFVANNDVFIVIEGAAGSQTYYTFGATGSVIPDPSTNSASDPVGYENGLSPSQVAYYAINKCSGDLTFKAIGEKQDGSPPSAIAQARFQFVTGNPVITGNNAAQFTVSDITTNAEMWYTTDGFNPTNGGSSIGPIPSGATLSLQFPAGGSNLTFKVMAFRDCYQPSQIVTAIFSSTNFVPNTISFGFAAGEASSAFVGSPGQTFYAPVTLTTLPNALMYSLQFNMTVTTNITAINNPNPGPAITPGAYGFQSMLVKPILPIPTNFPAGLAFYTNIPPAMFVGGGFTNLEFKNTSLNLLGVGWVERYGYTNLYDTLSQDLIQFSMAHDDLFPNAQQPNEVIVGGYGFQIPTNAASGHQYQIQIGLPSATDDGIGAPGSSVYIAAPANTNALGAGSINALKIVLVGQRQYLVGDAYPFRWFNAGDFGDTNLNNADVEQVFESAIYGLNTPPANTDFYNSMDSCGGTFKDLGHGYLDFNAYISGPAALNPLFDGNDTTINQIAFGDGVLDVCDVYVTFRRSLDPSLYWFQRFWTNGVRGASILTNQAASAKSLDSLAGNPVAKSLSSTNPPPSVNFAAMDFIASPGQTLQVPITAKVFGGYPLRVLMLNLSVEPLDGSPALTSPIQFKPNVALGSPAMSSSTGNGNYAATWLDSTIAGLSGTATLGTLTVTVPANAPSSAAYAIHFDHASASPNGIAAFPKQTLTGLITLSSRTSSSYNDGIADSWRLRWFGTIYNVLSTANADACGDGINNWDKYVAGSDPTDPTAYPRLNSRTPAPLGFAIAMHWPSVSGKQYVIERSSSLFTGSWSAIATNTGTGADMEFDDQHSGNASFYRVRILP
jgi:sugar lactone lactonase YvrE